MFKTLDMFHSTKEYQTCAQKTRYYFINYQVAALLTSYLNILDNLVNHLNTNFKLALLPDQNCSAEDIIAPVQDIYSMQGQKIGEETQEKFIWLTFDQLL